MTSIRKQISLFEGLEFSRIRITGNDGPNDMGPWISGLVLASRNGRSDRGGTGVFDGFLNEDSSEEERTEFSGLRTEKRRREFVLGRTASKRAIRNALRELGEKAVSADRITIYNDAKGRPMFRLASERLRPGLHLSISHINDRAVAAVDRHPIGIDIERIKARSRAWEKRVFSKAELDGTDEMSRMIPAQDKNLKRDAVLTGMWCAKEAVLKSLGLGLRLDPRDITVSVGEPGPVATLLHQGPGETRDGYRISLVKRDDHMLAIARPCTVGVYEHEREP